MKYETDEEIKTRIEELHKDLPNGLYHCGNSEFRAITGKKGYIEFEISLAISARNLLFNIPTKPKESLSKTYSKDTPITIEIVEEFIKDFDLTFLRTN
jgi:hypothetical protein